MSYTNSDFILRVVQDIGIAAEVDTAPSPEQGKRGLELLNDMMFEWEGMGIDLQYSKQTSTSDDCPIEDSIRQTVRCNLCARYVDQYGGTLRPTTASLAVSGLERLIRDAVLAGQVVQSTTHLPLDEASALRFGTLPGSL